MGVDNDAQFYATAAQVIPTLLIVFALEWHRVVPRGTSFAAWIFRMVAPWMLCAAGLAELAALLAIADPPHGETVRMI